jgi:hypothetical protein
MNFQQFKESTRLAAKLTKGEESTAYARLHQIADTSGTVGRTLFSIWHAQSNNETEARIFERAKNTLYKYGEGR